MAAHSDDSTVCTDDLQALFELAEVLHGKKERTHASEVECHLPMFILVGLSVWEC